MALISCPECGHQLSDTVTKCINCGVEIVYCPECKTPARLISESCANCGFRFHKEEKEKNFAEQIPQKEAIESAEEIQEENDLFALTKRIREKGALFNYEKLRKVSLNIWLAITGAAIVFLPFVMQYLKS